MYTEHQHPFSRCFSCKVTLGRKHLADEDDEDDLDDDDFTPGSKGKKKAKGKAKQSLDISEIGRAAMHTLDEQHTQLLSASFDPNGSFLADLGFDPSSSQIDPGARYGSFTFGGNDLFDPNEQLDLGLGDLDDILNADAGDAASGNATRYNCEPASQ